MLQTTHHQVTELVAGSGNSGSRLAEAATAPQEYFTVRDYRNRQKAAKEKRLLRKAARMLKAAA